MKKIGIQAIRTWIVVLIFLSTGIGLAFHVGWGTLSSMGVAALSYICPLGIVETFLATWTGIPRLVFALIAVVVIALLVGKAFCAWVCPVPVLQKIFKPGKKKRETHALKAGDAVSALEPTAPFSPEGGIQLAEDREPLPLVASEPCESGSSTSCEKALEPIGGKRDGLQLDSRHGVLAGALLSTAIFGFPVFCLVCPVGLIFATFIALWGLFAFAEVSFSLVVFPAILIFELLVFKKWCHKLCPMSALWSLLSKGNKTLVPKVEKSACLRSSGVDCDVCVKQCPEELDPHSTSIPECTKCGICVQACPGRAIGIPFIDKKKIV